MARVKRLRWKLRLAIGVVLAMALLARPASATTDTVGGTTSTYVPASVHAWVTPITASASGPLQRLGINFNSASGNIVLGIYANSGGSPAALLASSSATAAMAGWNDLTVTGVSIVSGTQYWIGASGSADTNNVYYGNPAMSHYKDYTYNGALPNPWGEDNGPAVGFFNMRMTYGTGTTTTTTASSTTTTAATTTTATGPSTTTTAATTTLPPTGIWILPGQLATVKFLTTLSPGTHTIKLCTASACQTGYLNIV